MDGGWGRRNWYMHARLYTDTSWAIKTSQLTTVPPTTFHIAPIREEPDHHQRQHRPRPPLARRADSAPQLISTTTTAPVHIHRSVRFVSPPPLPLTTTTAWRPPSAPRPSCPAATPSTPASAAPATSTSRQPPPASQQSPCATRSPASSPPSRTPPQRRPLTPRCSPSSTSSPATSRSAHRASICMYLRPPVVSASWLTLPAQRLGPHQVARRRPDRALQRASPAQELVQPQQARRPQGQRWSWNLHGCVSSSPCPSDVI
jgi:hypothetical protein